VRNAGFGLVGAILIALVAPARAGDLPASARYVKACKLDSPGFYQVPGTDTCLRIGGYQWAEGYYNSYTDYPVENDTSYAIATLGLQVDARAQTEYGTLRSFIDLRFQWRGSDPWSDAPERTEVQPWNLYVQFNGFTFGYDQSFFDFYDNQDVLGTDPATISDNVQTFLAAYTWSLANGYSATLSLEDASERAAGVAFADPTAADANDSPASLARVPDIVANVGQSADWGQFQLSAALHQVAATLGNGSDASTSDWGYALQAGVMFNLPAIASGDTLYIEGAYVDGAVSYLGLVNASGDFAPPDAYLAADGRLSRVSGWNIVGQYLHNWNATWNSAVFGGYARFDIDDPLAQFAYGASGVTNYNVGANVTWTPVAPLAFTVQYGFNVYAARDWRPTGLGLPVASQSAHQLLLMVARTF
jgi:hypothetical protein